MGHHRRSSFFDSFTLNPLPYPVLIILAVTFIFLGISWFFSYEEAVENAEEQMGWILFATPVILIVLVRWLSSFETDMFFCSKSPWERRCSTHHHPSEGSSPWGVPYQVLIILAVTFIFLGISWFFSYEEAIESAEEQMGWILFATPLVLIVLVRWLSSFETDMFFCSKSPWERRCSTHHHPSKGSSPWGVPYPVLIILAVTFIFLGISWFFSYEDTIESAEEQMGWILFATPVVLIVLVRWLSSFETDMCFSSKSPWERRCSTYHHPSEGSSPWGVVAFIVLLLVLVQYQSAFHGSWFV